MVEKTDTLTKARSVLERTLINIARDLAEMEQDASAHTVEEMAVSSRPYKTALKRFTGRGLPPTDMSRAISGIGRAPLARNCAVVLSSDASMAPAPCWRSAGRLAAVTRPP